MARLELDVAQPFGLELLSMAATATSRRWVVAAMVLTCLPVFALMWRSVPGRASVDDLDRRLEAAHHANEQLLDDVCGAVTPDALAVAGAAGGRGSPAVDPIYSSCSWRSEDGTIAVRLSAVPGLQDPVLEREADRSIAIPGADRAVAYVEVGSEGASAWTQHVEAEVDGVALQVTIAGPRPLPHAERAAGAIALDVAAALG